MAALATAKNACATGAHHGIDGDMKNPDVRPPVMVETVEVQRVSLIGRAVSWVILKLLGLTLITVVAGIGFAAFKYFVPGDAVPLPPVPYSPAAVASSPVPPIDYSQRRPPAGLTDNVPLPSLGYLPPPLPHLPPAPVAAHGAPHRQLVHAPQRPPPPPR